MGIENYTVIYDNDMPYKIPAMVICSLCDTGEYYTVILNPKCSYEKNIKSYLHELLHIDRGDLKDGVDADYAERVCHA